MNYRLTDCVRVFGSVLIAAGSLLSQPLEAQTSASTLVLRGANENPGVLPPHAKAFGKTYGEWSAAFWQWLYSLPVDAHPLFDTADCSEGQASSGRVWFLGGTFTAIEVEPGVVVGEADRGCTVPTGKALFFPIVNVECDTFEDPSASEDGLRECARFIADHIQNLQVTVDGTALGALNSSSYRVESPLFTFGPLPENNVLGVTPGSMFDSVGDGFFIMLAPLPVGAHEVHFSGDAKFTLEEDGFDFLFRLDIRYHIMVVP